MTREELKTICERRIKECETWAEHNGEKPSGRIYEENKLILELLEQEPCENIAKAFQFGMALGFGKRYDEIDNIINEIKNVITSPPKTGYWVEDEKQIHVERTYHCSECEYMIFGSERSDYCPGCGTKMIDTIRKQRIKNDNRNRRSNRTN